MTTRDNPDNRVEAVVRIEHALLVVADLARSLAFYRRLLPFWGVRWELKGETPARWIHFGAPGPGQPSYLSLCERPEARPFKDDGLVAGIMHVGFAHPDVSGLIARLRIAGITPTNYADDGRFRRVYFEDPDGHQLEFVESLDP